MAPLLFTNVQAAISLFWRVEATSSEDLLGSHNILFMVFDFGVAGMEDVYVGTDGEACEVVTGVIVR